MVASEGHGHQSVGRPSHLHLRHVSVSMEKSLSKFMRLFRQVR